MGRVAEMTLEAAVLKRLRREAGITQQGLAFRAGVSIALVVALEQGKRNNPRLDTLRKLAAGLGCSVGDLVGDQARRRPKRK